MITLSTMVNWGSPHGKSPTSHATTWDKFHDDLITHTETHHTFRLRNGH